MGGQTKVSETESLISKPAKAPRKPVSGSGFAKLLCFSLSCVVFLALMVNNWQQVLRGENAGTVKRELLQTDMATAASVHSVVRSTSSKSVQLPLANESSVENDVEALEAWKARYGVLSRLDSPRQEPGTLPTVAIIAHRELVVGCHSFEQFVSPDYHTWFVFDAALVALFHLRALVQASPNAHLLVLSNVGGEMLARAAVLRLLEMENSLPEFFYYSHCDLQPLPPKHAFHTPFTKYVKVMTEAFQLEKAKRKEGRTDVQVNFEYLDVGEVTTCIKERQDRSLMPILVMNNVIVEDPVWMKSLEDSTFHSHDVGGFVRQNGFSMQKPSLEDPEDAWLSDIGTWVEDHSDIFDVELFMQVLHRLEVLGDYVTEGPRVLPKVMCERGWTAIRHNHIFTFYELFQPNFVTLDGFHIWDPAWAEPFDHNEIRKYNLQLLTLRNSPWGTLREVMSIAHRGRFRIKSSWGNGFTRIHYMQEWLPDEVQVGKTFEELIPLIFPLFEIIGWDRVDVHEYSGAVPEPCSASPQSCMIIRKTDHIFSKDLEVTLGEKRKCKRCALFLSWELPDGRVLEIWTVKKKGRHRILTIPLNATLRAHGPPMMKKISGSRATDDFCASKWKICKKKGFIPYPANWLSWHDKVPYREGGCQGTPPESILDFICNETEDGFCPKKRKVH